MAFEGEFRTGHSTVMAEILKALGLEGQSVKRLVLEFDPRKVITAYVVLHAKGVDAVPEILARAEGIEFRQVDAVEVRPDATVEASSGRAGCCEHGWSNTTRIQDKELRLHRRTCHYCGMIQVATHEAVMLGDPDWKQVQA